MNGRNTSLNTPYSLFPAPCSLLPAPCSLLFLESPDIQSRYVSILGNPKGLAQEVVGKVAWKWHHDQDGVPRTEGLDMNALYVVVLYGLEVPLEGVEGQPHTTEFLDMVEAYNNLDHRHQQQLEGTPYDTTKYQRIALRLGVVDKRSIQARVTDSVAKTCDEVSTFVRVST